MRHPTSDFQLNRSGQAGRGMPPRLNFFLAADWQLFQGLWGRFKEIVLLENKPRGSRRLTRLTFQLTLHKQKGERDGEDRRQNEGRPRRQEPRLARHTKTAGCGHPADNVEP